MPHRKFHSAMMATLIASGRVDQWSRYSTGGAYTDAIQIGDYKVQLQDDGTDTRILLWNPTRPCLAMVLDNRDKVASLDSVHYSPECTVSGRMKRGEGTRAMITFALDILRQRGARTVQLMDNSSVVCNGVKVRLGLMYFFKYGQTWYETYFGFKPDSAHADRYARAKTIQKTLGLSEKPCDYFTDEVLDELVLQTKLVFFPRIVWEKQLG
jgi:hypothetical protein